MSANRRAEAIARLRSFVRFVEQEGEKMVEQVLELSRSHRLFAPLAYTVGAFATLLGGLLLGDWWLSDRAAAGHLAVADDVRPAAAGVPRPVLPRRPRIAPGA